MEVYDKYAEGQDRKFEYTWEEANAVDMSELENYWRGLGYDAIPTRTERETNIITIEPPDEDEIQMSHLQEWMKEVYNPEFDQVFFDDDSFTPYDSVFADEFYEEISSVIKIKTYEELHNQIKMMLSNTQIQNKELNALMESLENTSISVPYFSMIKDGITLSSIQRYENNVELTQKKFKEFYEFYNNSFEILSTTINNKI